MLLIMAGGTLTLERGGAQHHFARAQPYASITLRGCKKTQRHHAGWDPVASFDALEGGDTVARLRQGAVGSACVVVHEPRER